MSGQAPALRRARYPVMTRAHAHTCERHLSVHSAARHTHFLLQHSHSCMFGCSTGVCGSRRTHRLLSSSMQHGQWGVACCNHTNAHQHMLRPGGLSPACLSGTHYTCTPHIAACRTKEHHHPAHLQPLHLRSKLHSLPLPPFPSHPPLPPWLRPPHTYTHTSTQHTGTEFGIL